MFEIFNVIFTYPITNILVGFYKLFSAIGLPYAFGFSLIALTAAIRGVLYPFTAAQIKSAAKMQKIAPHLNRIRELHKGDNKRQQEEFAKLYREHGVNPAGGCLPLLIQFPITIALYNVLRNAVAIHNAKTLLGINHVIYFDFLKLQQVWDTSFFGLPLGKNPMSLLHAAPLIVLIPLFTALLQFLLGKMMLPEEVIKAEEKIVKETKTKEDDFQVAFQKQSMYFLPVFLGYLAFQFPIGLSLYWNTFSLFGILQQYILIGPGAAAPWFRKVKIGKK